MIDQLTFAPATEADSDRLSDIILGEPAQFSRQVGMRLFGIRDLSKAATLWRIINRQSEAWRLVTLAKSGDDTVGVLLTPTLDISISVSLVARVTLLFGPLWLARLPRRMRLQRRVQTDRIEGAYNVGELHVDSSARGRGIGSALLVEAERQARGAGQKQMTLQVLIGNPAIRLYERFGFTSTQARTDEDFEALTGSPGYQAMLKQLD